MRQLGLLCLVGLWLTACSGTHQRRTLSVLERFDRLRLPLRSVTSRSSEVAADLVRLNGAMQHDNVPLARRRAIELKLAAIQLYRQAGRCGNQIRGLNALRSAPKIHTYLRTILATLMAQYSEGVWIARLADVAWYDPLGVLSADVRRLLYTGNQARHGALRATHLASAAARWKARYRRYFRYVPVHAIRRHKNIRKTGGNLAWTFDWH